MNGYRSHVVTPTPMGKGELRLCQQGSPNMFPLTSTPSKGFVKPRKGGKHSKRGIVLSNWLVNLVMTHLPWLEVS